MSEKPNYKQVVAYDYYCLPACLEMVADQFDGNSRTQEEIGSLIGVDTTSSEDLSVGAKVEEEKLYLLFEGNNIDLSYIKANHIEEWMFEDLIEQKLGQGCHIICTLSSGILLDHAEKELGHAVLISYLSRGTVEFIDPGPNNPGIKKTSIETLYRAARYREGGLIVIRSI